jgi:hypothetical protein
MKFVANYTEKRFAGKDNILFSTSRNLYGAGETDSRADVIRI